MCSDLTEATLAGGSLSIAAAVFIAFLVVAVRVVSIMVVLGFFISI